MKRLLSTMPITPTAQQKRDDTTIAGII